MVLFCIEFDTKSADETHVTVGHSVFVSVPPALRDAALEDIRGFIARRIDPYVEPLAEVYPDEPGGPVVPTNGGCNNCRPKPASSWARSFFYQITITINDHHREIYRFVPTASAEAPVGRFDDFIEYVRGDFSDRYRSV